MSSAPQLADTELIRLMIGGSEDAFSAVYQRCGPAVYRFALHMTTDPQLAEEIAQETFLILIRNPRGYDAAKGSLFSWLLGIARNVSRRTCRAAAETGSLDDESLELPAACDLSGDVTRREEIGAVRAAIASLPAAYREVVILCELQEIDYVEASTILKCPVGTVRSRLHRARKILASKLQPRCFV